MKITQHRWAHPLQASTALMAMGQFRPRPILACASLLLSLFVMAGSAEAAATPKATKQRAGTQSLAYPTSANKFVGVSFHTKADFWHFWDFRTSVNIFHDTCLMDDPEPCGAGRFHWSLPLWGNPDGTREAVVKYRYLLYQDANGTLIDGTLSDAERQQLTPEQQAALLTGRGDKLYYGSDKKLLCFNKDDPNKPFELCRNAATGPVADIDYNGEVKPSPMVPNRPLIHDHADRLAAAGVDFIILDFTNAELRYNLFKQPTHALLKVFEERIHAGKATPRVVFHGPACDNAFTTPETIWAEFYGRYDPAVFFRFGGRPLYLYGSGNVTQPSVCTTSRFTVRRMEGLKESGRFWSYKDVTRPGSERRFAFQNGWPEEVSVTPAVGSCAMNMAQGTYHNPVTDSDFDCDAQLWRNNGQTFGMQAREALDVQPTFAIIWSWNEGGAQNCSTVPDLPACKGVDAHGNASWAYPYSHMADAFRWEGSADLEPTFHPDPAQRDLYVGLLKNFVTAFRRNKPIFTFRHAASGEWRLKFYRGRSDLAGHSNFNESFSWASGAHYQSAVADFSGDGQLDLAMRDTTTGRWSFMRHVAPGAYAGEGPYDWSPGAHYQPLVADFSGDGLVDLALRDTTTGTWHFTRNLGNYQFAGHCSFAWAQGAHYQPLVADFSGDGLVDLALRDTTTGTWHFMRNLGNCTFAGEPAFAGTVGAHYQPLAADVDGDGLMDIALRDPTVMQVNDPSDPNAPSYSLIHLSNGVAPFQFRSTEAYRGPPGAGWSVQMH
ncbi:FG-GAP-like repeat-containing protein [Pyxidicoccus xibeiensis]|uniref:FG-GAP-like repeat-containing protein n=1 Tax=Pyxidicoccus xibeiensis TaxID=2906759 RepID=UPI0020A8325A|nr:FG-GAP-like repeat-containing protein [Pyxidicoccus xibeiensis]MCP3138350.1 FG-GAP-like repeat-containing protein [Pyxidicoccus xibeiensis]